MSLSRAANLLTPSTNTTKSKTFYLGHRPSIRRSRDYSGMPVHPRWNVRIEKARMVNQPVSLLPTVVSPAQTAFR